MSHCDPTGSSLFEQIIRYSFITRVSVRLIPTVDVELLVTLRSTKTPCSGLFKKLVCPIFAPATQLFAKMRLSRNSIVSLLLAGCLVSAAPRIEKRSSRTWTPCGCLTVKESGNSTGQYSSLSAAVAALGTGNSSSSACIFMYPGNYSDKVVINYKGNLTLYGWTTK